MKLQIYLYYFYFLKVLLSEKRIGSNVVINLTPIKNINYNPINMIYVT